ncbi:MAG: hypothetical protein WC006_03115 [Bacilli bacterium]
MRKKILMISILIIALLFSISFDNLSKAEDLDTTRDRNTHDFEPIVTKQIENTFITYTDFRPILFAIVNDVVEDDNYNDVRNMMLEELEIEGSEGTYKTIRFDSALELYNFSVDASYNRDKIESFRFEDKIVQALLSLNYTLGMDIDYSVMGAQQFMPIGYNFTSPLAGTHEAVFTGIFDGRGFEISNLYAAGYDYLVFTEGTGEEAQDIPLSTFYSMFTENKGTIKNLGLVNPTFEIRNVHDNILRAANLAGLNHGNGVINKVYVIDNREDVAEAGIRMRTPIGASDSEYQAAGVVFENQATFTEAYFAGKVVVNSSYINNFEVQPVLYEDSGDSDKLVYDSTRYLEEVEVGQSSYIVTSPNEFALGETEEVIKGSSSLGTNGWYYYPDYRHPAIFGLDKNGNDEYIIKNAVDFISFSKMISFVPSVESDIRYYNLNYVITDDIDFTEVSKGAYKTPENVFGGSLSGTTNDDKNYYLSNLELINGVNLETEYFAGLFSSVSGTISNITLDNFKIKLEDTQLYYSSLFYIGGIAGRSTGNINNVSVNLEIDLGNLSIGEYAVGGIVGEASGNVNGVYTEGIIKNNIRTFNSDFDVDTNYYIGGIIGKTESKALTLYNALNTMTINGLGTSNQVDPSSSSVNIYTGGVIGFVQNLPQARHNLGFITNQAEININNYKSTKPVHQYVAGVVGYSSGVNYKFDENTGEWTNTNVEVENLNDEANINVGETTNFIHSAGVVVSNHSEKVEFLYLFNYTNYSINSYTNFNYSALVYDIGSEGVILSQSTNYANYEIIGNYNFSGVFLSKNNSQSLLRFVENRGDITYKDQTFLSERSIAGITLSTNIDFLNVYFSGNIFVYNTVSAYPLWVAGIAKELSVDKYMINSMTRGKDYEYNPDTEKDELVPSKIIVANHNTGTVKSTSSAHVYIGGLVNTNMSGDLQTVSKATKGIINSINYANISTNLNGSLYGIKGNGNTFAGGITTFNAGSIQDTANMGDINVSNISSMDAAEVKINTGQNYGGRVDWYYGSVILGGVASSTIVGYPRIFDSTNSGNITALTTNLARAGGVLGLSLIEELEAADLPSYVITPGIVGAGRSSIENSILSNCINYGNISSITQKIEKYNPAAYTSSIPYYLNATGTSPTLNRSITPNEQGSDQRLGVYSSAGGVIGYGLCEMIRMLNHGNISSTDVAGGIVGATYAGITTTTTVKINTAMNYGSIRMINLDEELDDLMTIEEEWTNFEIISKIINEGHTRSFEDMFYPVDHTFITPNSPHVREYPMGKRGIGGIFGRLQRTYNRTMTSNNGSFTFIVNMDPNVDLIGRLDQVYNFTSSNRYFVFRDAKYYSAKPNDTTQGTFTGYGFFEKNSTTNVAYVNGTISEYVTRERIFYEEEVSGRNRRYFKVTEQYVLTAIDGILSSNESTYYEINGGQRITIADASIYVNRTYDQFIWRRISREQVSSSGTNSEYNVTPFTRVRTNDYVDAEYVTGSTGRIITGSINVPYVTENPDNLNTAMPNHYFIYDEEFEMRTDPSLTQYIYYVENEVLSPRFKESRPYGMYVLSTSAGSSVGSTLPANVDITKLYPIDGLLVYNGDYLNPQRGSLEEDIIDNYISLLQTEYNDKSAIINPTSNNIKLVEVDENGDIGGARTVLVNPTINTSTRSITFQLNKNQIPGQSVLRYKIVDADLPVNAKIGPELTSGVNPEIDPILTLNNTNNGTRELGVITSYSEAAREVSAFRTTKYTTTYTININIIDPSPTGPSITHYRTTESGTWQSITSNPTVTDHIGFRFRDRYEFLPDGAEIYKVSLWYGSEEVLTDYYTLTTEKVSGSGASRYFSIQLKLQDSNGNNVLKGGEYTIKYRYYYLDNGGVDREVSFTKAESSNNEILSMSYYGSDVFAPWANQFTTTLKFGYPMDLIENPPGYDFDEDTDIPSYLNRRTYTIPNLTTLTLSPFAEVTSARLVSRTYNTSTGLITYVYEYVIHAENGSPRTYTHTINEESVNIVNYFKNNNKVSGSGLFATREAVSTKFSFDLGIDSSYANLIYNYGTDNDIYFVVSNLISGVTIRTDSYLDLHMDQSVPTGNYTFGITLVRKDGVNLRSISLGNVTIEKRPGVNAHLTDIRFSETVQDTSYPLIYVANEDGTIKEDSPYRPRIFFAGIDYNGSNVDENVIHYRINGEVANTPLNEYMPFFLDFLPPGAKISRKHYNSVSDYYWTTPVDKYSDPALISTLLTDFTVYPDTKLEYGAEDRGNDGIEDDDILITYKVISESTTSGEPTKVIYYHISVIDIVYNVSMVFTVNYDESANDLKGNPLLINVQNFNTNLPWGETVINDPALFPEFSSITLVNNKVNLFYIENIANYKFRFGRNMSGFYSFDVILPQAETGYVYKYKIEYTTSTSTYELYDTSVRVSGVSGKYYYINYGEKNRTRNFTITISKVVGASDPSWGIIDDYNSWSK